MNAQQRAAEAGVEPTVTLTEHESLSLFTFHHWCYAFEEWATVHNQLPLGGAHGWTLTNTDPITITPSIWCHGCDSHGFFTDGQWSWVPASTG